VYIHTIYVCTYVKLHVNVHSWRAFFGFNFLLRGFKRVLCKYTFLNLPGLRSQIVHSNRLSNYFCFCIDIIDTVLMMVVLVQKCSEVGIGLTFLSQEIFCQDPGGRTGD